MPVLRVLALRFRLMSRMPRVTSLHMHRRLVTLPPQAIAQGPVSRAVIGTRSFL